MSDIARRAVAEDRNVAFELAWVGGKDGMLIRVERGCASWVDKGIGAGVRVSIVQKRVKWQSFERRCF
jgi:hypothetical protein